MSVLKIYHLVRHFLSSFGLAFKYATRFCILFFLGFAAKITAESSDMYVRLNLQPEPEAAEAVLSNGVKLRAVPYNSKEFALYYQVFVYNNNVEYAYDVARIAVKNDPNDNQWREKLAQAALWSGHLEEALGQWIYLLNKNAEPEKFIDQAKKLAEQLHDYDNLNIIVAYQLKQNPTSKPLILQYSTAMEDQGYPLAALKYLQGTKGVYLDKEYLKQLASIATNMDDPKLLIEYLNLWYKIDQKNPEVSLKLSEYHYLRGNLDMAFRVLHSNAMTIPESNNVFWSTYGAISYLDGQLNSSVIAYQHLFKIHQISKNELLQLIDMEYSTGQYQKAYEHARFAYSTHHETELISMILGLGETLNKWQELKTFIDSLPSKELNALKGKIDTAIILANIYAHLGLFQLAYHQWEDIFTRWPDATLAQQSYIWFLIDNDFSGQLQHTLKRWCKLLINKDSLWHVYYSALIELGDNVHALQVMLQHHKIVFKSYEHLTALADLFDKTDNDFAAYYAGRQALVLLMKDIAKKTHQMSTQQKLSLIQLMNSFAPAANTYHAVANLSKNLFKTKEIDNQVMDWALNNDNYELATYIKKIHDIYRIKTTPWMALSIAMAYNDQQAMGELLQKSPKRLPHRDRVTAAVMIENMKLAEQLAYQGLEEHPKDSDMYDLFIDTMIPRSNEAYVGSYYKGYNSAVGPLETLGGRVFMTPSIALIPFASGWFPHTTNTDNVFWVPSRDVVGGLKVKKYIHKGWMYLKVGERKSLESFMFGALAMRQQLDARWSGDVILSYHKRADETLQLELGGMKNEAAVLLTYIYDNYNTLETRLNIDQFLGQDGTHLGAGEELEVHWQNKLFLSYPDWNVNVYGYWNNYQYTNTALSLPLQQFFAPGSDADTSFIMPENYTQLEFTIGAGQNYKRDYTQFIKGFFEAGLSYGSPFGIGEIVQGGFSSSIFGRDHLVLYGEYSNNQKEAGQNLFKVGMRYDTFF